MSRPDLALVSAYPPAGDLHGGSSGVASYTANLARALASHGLEVAVVAPREDPDDPMLHRDGTVSVHRCGPRGPRALDAAVEVARRIDARTVHLQHEWFLWGGPASVPTQYRGLAALRRTRSTVVTTMHQVVRHDVVDRDFTRVHGLPPLPTTVAAGLGVLQRSLARLSHGVIVHEPAFATALPGGRVIPHGLEPGSRLPRATARRALGLDDRLTVLNFGFVAPYKGLDVALGAIEAAGPHVHGVVAGGPHPRHGEEAIRHLRARFDHTARFTGFVPDDDVAPWFRASDVALLLYPRPHASSGVLALALAHDCPALLSPALAHTVGAPPEMTVPLDPVAVARRLHDLSVEPGALDQVRAAGRALATGRAWPDVAAAHADLYEETSRAHDAPGRRLRPAQPRGRGPGVRVRDGAARLDGAGDIARS